jgi:Spy/CpxP family protein refolding chaperone
MERALGALDGHLRFWNNPQIVEKLKLTDEQRKAMDDTLLQHRETLVDLRGNLEKAELTLEPLMNADQPDEARILAQIDAVAQARAELEKANARFLLAIRSKLTPEQWKQVQAFRANRQEMRHNWRPGGQGPGGPGGQAAPPPGGPQGQLDDGPGLDEPMVPGLGANQ